MLAQYLSLHREHLCHLGQNMLQTEMWPKDRVIYLFLKCITCMLTRGVHTTLEFGEAARTILV